MSPVEAQMNQRLAAVEHAVSELHSRLAALAPAGNWLDQVTGLLKDEPAFEEVLQLGRAMRSADRPQEEPGE